MGADGPGKVGPDNWIFNGNAAETLPECSRGVVGVTACQRQGGTYMDMVVLRNRRENEKSKRTDWTATSERERDLCNFTVCYPVSECTCPRDCLSGSTALAIRGRACAS